MRKLLFTLLSILFSATIVCGQEVFTDTISGKECLFLGSLSLDYKMVKVLEDNQIRWKVRDSIRQTGMLSLPEFLDELFTHNLHFELSGYEPFWHAVIAKDKMIYSDAETGKDTTYPMRIINSRTLGYGMYFMFSSPDGEAFGLAYSTGLTTPEKQQCCEFDVTEEDISLYCAYLSINNVAYHGCAIITKR